MGFPSRLADHPAVAERAHTPPGGVVITTISTDGLGTGTAGETEPATRFGHGAGLIGEPTLCPQTSARCGTRRMAGTPEPGIVSSRLQAGNKARIPSKPPAWTIRGMSAPAGRTDSVLAGFTVAVTADGRRDELVPLLEANGARVVLAPALRPVPVGDDAGLREATCQLLEKPPDAVVASTEISLLGWLSGDGGASVGLAGWLVTAYWLPMASGGDDLQPAGLPHAWSPDTDSVAEVLEYLTTQLPGVPASDRGPSRQPAGGLAAGRPREGQGRPQLAGRRIAVQLDGEPPEAVCTALTSAGAEVIEIPVYRWAPPTDPAPCRLVDLMQSLVDAVTATSTSVARSYPAGPQARPRDRDAGFSAGRLWRKAAQHWAGGGTRCGTAMAGSRSWSAPSSPSCPAPDLACGG
jgi:uroporphyrinogen-III synthase